MTYFRPFVGWRDFRKFWEDTVFLIESTKFLTLSFDIFQPPWLNTDFMPEPSNHSATIREKLLESTEMQLFLNHYTMAIAPYLLSYLYKKPYGLLVLATVS